LPDGLKLEGDIAIDTEAMGLNNRRDRLCLVQLSTGDGNAHLVKFERDSYDAPNLRKLLSNPDTMKLFHFARFDVSIMRLYLGVLVQPIYCTRTASRLVRTFTDRHGLKDLCRDLIGKEISKQQQSSDWGAPELTTEQKEYAANDVLYLHQLRTVLDKMIAREGRQELARACFNFLPARAMLDLAGWEDQDIFAHQ
jgi:ribonuclease D